MPRVAHTTSHRRVLQHQRFTEAAFWWRRMGVMGGRSASLVQGVIGFVMGALFATLLVSRPAVVRLSTHGPTHHMRRGTG